MNNLKRLLRVGIVGFSIYLPELAISPKEIAKAWNRENAKIGESLGILRKTVAQKDEDSITMAVEAGKAAIEMADISPSKIGALFMGSESHPYAVKPSGTIIGEALGLGNEYLCADLQFACKAAAAGLQIAAAMIESGMIDYGLVIGSDKAQAKPRDILEYSASSAAAAFLLGPKKESVAEFLYTDSFSSDTPDFWRRQGCDFPQHLGRFTGEPAYFKHIEAVTKNLLSKSKYKISDFDHVVFHMPNSKFPAAIAQKLGVTDRQLKQGFTVLQIGNPYSASCLVGMARVLEKARPGDNILVVSYGSGSGSDGFVFKTTKLQQVKKTKKSFDDFVHNLEEIDYSSYLNQMEII